MSGLVGKCDLTRPQLHLHLIVHWCLSRRVNLQARWLIAPPPPVPIAFESATLFHLSTVKRLWAIDMNGYNHPTTQPPNFRVYASHWFKCIYLIAEHLRAV